MKVKDLIKILRERDPEEYVVSRMSIFDLRSPTVGEEEFVKRKIPSGKIGWETKKCFDRREGKYKAEFIESKKFLTV